MERELLVTGIGGQGVQLAAQVLARGATLEGSHVMLFGVYGGAMRGMNTDATVVIGDGPLMSPPLISHTWSAIGMHDKFWGPIGRKLRDDALVLVNDATFETELDTSRYRVLRVPATDLADELGNPLGGSMVMAGAYAATKRAGRSRCAGRRHARIDPAIPPAAHRGERDRDPDRPRLGARSMSGAPDNIQLATHTKRGPSGPARRVESGDA